MSGGGGGGDGDDDIECALRAFTPHTRCICIKSGRSFQLPISGGGSYILNKYPRGEREGERGACWTGNSQPIRPIVIWALMTMMVAAHSSQHPLASTCEVLNEANVFAVRAKIG